MTTNNNNMAVEARDVDHSTVLLRRPLPPKPNVDHRNLNLNGDKKRREKLIKIKNCKKLPKSIQKLDLKEVEKEYPTLDLSLFPSKPSGPDPLPSRKPKRAKENSCEYHVDERFLPSLPEFTLEDFMQMCCATDRPGTQLKSWKYVDETKYLKQADQIGSNEINKYILYGKYLCSESHLGFFIWKNLSILC